MQMPLSLSLVSLTLLMATVVPIHAQDQRIQRWRSDLSFILTKIESTHPDPWQRTSREAFLREIDSLVTLLPTMDEEETIVRTMQLVARLGDSHTLLCPFNHPLITTWFPVRFDRFADGIFITTIDQQYAEIVGGKVLRLGRLSAADAFERVGSVTSVDSRFELTRTVPVYLSNAAILSALGVIADIESLPLEIETPSGQTVAMVIPSTSWHFDLGWIQDRSLVPGGGEAVNVFSGRSADLPLHLRKFLSTREHYWLEVLADQRALYVQINAVRNGPENFAEFVHRLWDTYEKRANVIDKLIIDLRYNEGGDGSLLRSLVHGIIRHDAINQRGSLFVIIGERTHSAASVLLGKLYEHTAVISVGEPAGPVNMFSDIERLQLPSGMLALDVSTAYWQSGHALDQRGYFPPDCLVPVTAEDYFAGRDRALEAILSDQAVPLENVLMERGMEAFVAEYERQARLHAPEMWWFPYTVFDLRRMGIDLLTSGRKEEAIRLFEFTAQRHPDVYWTWEVLGNLYASCGDREKAIRNLRKALNLNPNEVFVKQSLTEVEGQ